MPEKPKYIISWERSCGQYHSAKFARASRDVYEARKQNKIYKKNYHQIEYEKHNLC